jgi:membrane protein implicated in regulation of membrane protease activity
MDSADAMRRWLGLFCLTMAAGMLIWGQTLLKPLLEGWLYIGYWTLGFIFTFGAIVIALLDIRALRRRTRREQKELLERTLAEVEEESVRKQDTH